MISYHKLKLNTIFTRQNSARNKTSDNCKQVAVVVVVVVDDVVVRCVHEPRYTVITWFPSNQSNTWFSRHNKHRQPPLQLLFAVGATDDHRLHHLKNIETPCGNMGTQPHLPLPSSFPTKQSIKACFTT